MIIGKVFATAVAAWTLAETCGEAKQKCSDLVDSYNDFVCSQTPELEAKIFIDEIHQFAGMDPNNLYSYLFGLGFLSVRGICLFKTPLNDERSEMTWIPWLVLDFPISLVTLDLAFKFPTNFGAVFFIGITGGLLWSFYGYLMAKFFIWTFGHLMTRSCEK